MDVSKGALRSQPGAVQISSVPVGSRMQNSHMAERSEIVPSMSVGYERPHGFRDGQFEIHGVHVRDAENALNRTAPANMNALQYAGRFGQFPSPAECAAARRDNPNTPLVQRDDIQARGLPHCHALITCTAYDDLPSYPSDHPENVRFALERAHAAVDAAELRAKRNNAVGGNIAIAVTAVYMSVCHEIRSEWVYDILYRSPDSPRHFILSLHLLEACYLEVDRIASQADAISQILENTNEEQPLLTVLDMHRIGPDDIEEALHRMRGILHFMHDDFRAIFHGDIEPIMTEGHVTFRQLPVSCIKVTMTMPSRGFPRYRVQILQE